MEGPAFRTPGPQEPFRVPLGADPKAPRHAGRPGAATATGASAGAGKAREGEEKLGRKETRFKGPFESCLIFVGATQIVWVSGEDS